jgi:Zn-dependent protease
MMPETALALRTCPSCARDLPMGAVVCAACHALVYAGELEKLAAEARALEAQKRPGEARAVWLKALQLLPADANQAAWVRTHARQLEMEANAPPRSENPWVQRLAPLGPVALLLAKAKLVLTALFNMKFLLTLAAFLVIYWKVFGAKFGVGFGIAILIHEMGHYIDIRRRGLPADMPVFLPGLGAYVRWQGLGVSLAQRAQISLAGPLAGLLAAAACYGLWLRTGVPLWAALARAGAWLNVINLIPVAILDGGQAALALSRLQRVILLTAAVALWIFLGESAFFLVAAGATFRLFTKDRPAAGDNGVLIYFLAVLAALGLVMHAVPGRGMLPGT